MRNNFVYRTGEGDVGINLWGATNALVANNRVRVFNYRAAIEVQDGTGVRIFNNVANTALWDRGGSQFEARGNLWDAADADFLAPDDAHRRAGNRAIGAGVAVPEVSSDIDGEPLDGRYDVRADHFGG